MEVMGRPKLPVEPRFWAKVDKSGECWVWTGATNHRGYGVFQVDYKAVYAHRFSLELAGRPLQEGEYACHHCDNPPCVRPDHLYAGSALTNSHDARSRGRLRPYHPTSEQARAQFRAFYAAHPERHPERMKTHCPRGHEYTLANTYRRKNGSRQCRTCVLARNADWARRCRNQSKYRTRG